MADNKKVEEVDIEEVSGGSIEGLGNMGYRVFDATTNQTIAICAGYGDAVHLAKRHSVSGLGTWGDDSEGLKRRRELEDKHHVHSPIAGFED